VTTSSEWARFFEAHAPVYMNNVFTRNTLPEVDFLLEHLRLCPGMRLLDVGCGTGRHSVELARRGLEVTGIDLSAAMLAQAHKAAASAGVSCRFVEADAARYRPEGSFDAVICLCEGAFCLLGGGDDPIDRDLNILRMVAAALVPGGRFMLTALSAARLIRAYDKPDFANRFDLRTLVETGTHEVGNPQSPVRVETRERGYVATEIELMCRTVGLAVDHIGGGTAGNWGIRPIDPDEYELMLLAHKP
jgi:SAM-dependent methyltransferase